MIVEFFERVCHRCRRSPRPFSYSTRKTRSTVVLVDSTDCALSELLGKTFMVVFPHTLVVMCKEVADVLCGGRIIAVLGRSRWIGKSRHLGSSQSGGAYSYHNSLRLSVGKYTMTRSMLMYMYPSHQAKVRLQYHSPYS